MADVKSPEEQKEQQKKNCIFCQIIAGKVASKKIYEDEKVIAILDINPANPGHILLLPKEHYMIMPLIPDEELKYLAIITKKLSQALLQAFKAEGTTIFIANGLAAGQKAQHFMVHIIPRKQNDSVGIGLPEHKISEHDMDEIYKHLTKRFNELYGIIPNVVEAEFTEKKESPKMLDDKKPDIKKEKPESKKENIDLNDISKLLLGK